MPPKTPSPVLTPEQFLAGFPAEVRELCDTLRRLIRAELPECVEAVNPVWRGIGYRHPSAGYLGAIFPDNDRVRLGFEWGVLLDDPNHLLSGSSRQMRFVVLLPGQAIPADGILRLLRQAVSLPTDRRTRQLLVAQSARPVSE